MDKISGYFSELLESVHFMIQFVVRSRKDTIVIFEKNVILISDVVDHQSANRLWFRVSNCFSQAA